MPRDAASAQTPQTLVADAVSASQRIIEVRAAVTAQSSRPHRHRAVEHRTTGAPVVLAPPGH